MVKEQERAELHRAIWQIAKFVKVLGKENVRQGFFGQESNLTIYNLCRINMFLHDINYNHFDIAHGGRYTD